MMIYPAPTTETADPWAGLLSSLGGVAVNALADRIGGSLASNVGNVASSVTGVPIGSDPYGVKDDQLRAELALRQQSTAQSAAKTRTVIFWIAAAVGGILILTFGFTLALRK